MTAIDPNGLPIIPGKRLKGLLRECGFVLESASAYKGTTERLFGTSGDSPALVQISNAELDEAKDIAVGIQRLRADSHRAGEAALLTADMVTSLYTIVRTSTAISEQGTALDKTLRSIQAVKRGQYFTFYITGEVSEPESDFLVNCACSLRRIGLNKSRGFGEVVCTAEKIVQEGGGAQSPVQSATSEDVLTGASSGTKAAATHWEDDLVVIGYSIKLEQDVVLGKIGLENPDYISGSVVLAVFANWINSFDKSSREEYQKLILKEAIFSNAYIANGSETNYPALLGIAMVKNEDNVAYSFVDGYEGDSSKQYRTLTGYGHLENNLYHQRSCESYYSFHAKTDTDGKDKQFFTLHALTAGQFFRGSITATRKGISLLREAVAQTKGTIRLGGGSSAQFGKAKIALEGNNQDANQTLEIQVGGDYVLECHSDVILVDSSGVNLADPRLIEQELSENYGQEIFESRWYTRVATISGYNALWRLPRRQYLALAKGSCARIKVNEGASTIPSTIRAGLFVNEGYGEIAIRPVEQVVLAIHSDNNPGMEGENPSTDCDMAPVESLLKAAKTQNAKEVIANRAWKDANRAYEKNRSDITKSQLANLINVWKKVRHLETPREEFLAVCNNPERVGEWTALGKTVDVSFDACLKDEGVKDSLPWLDTLEPVVLQSVQSALYFAYVDSWVAHFRYRVQEATKGGRQ
jgi:CRISPR/Cas system CSM-associated protein Csm3 (group 7 of RAMP superfamily)